MTPSRQRPQYTTTDLPHPADSAAMVVVDRSIAGSKTRVFQSAMSRVAQTVEMTHSTAWPDKMVAILIEMIQTAMNVLPNNQNIERSAADALFMIVGVDKQRRLDHDDQQQ